VITVLSRYVHSAQYQQLVSSAAAQVDHAPLEAVDSLQSQSASAH